MNDWVLAYEGFDAASEGHREALCTLGNGYFATRGAAAEAQADGVHYPGTYLAGGYDRLVSEIAGQRIENEDLVNLPNWLALRLCTGAHWLCRDGAELLECSRRLDLRRGLLERTVRWRDAEGRITGLVERRLVHMGEPHLAALSIEVTAENWSGALGVRSALDGRIENAGVARYRPLDGRHLEVLDARSCGPDTIGLLTRMRQSRVVVAQAARTRLFRAGQRLDIAPGLQAEAACVALAFDAAIAQGESLRIEKVVSLYTSRDRAISEPAAAACEALSRAADFAALAATHALAWEQLWRRFDVVVEENGDTEPNHTQLTVRLHLFHLLQTVSPHTTDLDVGVPARGWHGEAYRGHVFWDELFIFPLLNLHLPEVTRALLRYRYRRLNEARANARAIGQRGALYPWQSGSSGREESQKLHLNPASGRWLPDHTWLQRHVNAAVAYNVWQYHQVTGDLEFLSFFGAEMLLEIARFWAGFATYNAELDRYEIRGVVGPDEFHTALPGAERPGLDNHAYTSVMAVWVLMRAREVLALLPPQRCRELCERLDLRDEELAQWDEVASKMRVLFMDDTADGDGLVSQFEGYESLAELDWDALRARHGDIHRLDRLLEAEGDSVNRYKAAKQADVLMLFYLFSTEELGEIFARLGYPFDGACIPRNVAYYLARTSHGSSLSRVADSWVLARSDRAGSWRVFKEALRADIADTQGGTTAEGIHLGAMAGVVDLLQRGYTGLEMRGDALWLNPRLPDELARLELSIRYRGHALELRIAADAVELHVQPSRLPPLRVVVAGTAHEVPAGETRCWRIAPPATVALRPPAP